MPDIFLYAGETNPNDVKLRDPTISFGFPTQFFGLKAFFQAASRDLCLVAEADAPTGMGAVLKLMKGGTKYVIYLVETTDPNASPVYVRTTTGTKAIRKKT